MRGLKSATSSVKKPASVSLRRKAEPKIKKEKVLKAASKKKDANAPKRPAGAFFIFMEDFRKSFKLSHPDAKSGPAVGKAGGEKWKSMSETEKAPYVEKASKRKAEYEINLQEYKKKLVNDIGDAEKSTVTEKSSSEIHDFEVAGQEEVCSSGNKTCIDF